DLAVGDAELGGLERDEELELHLLPELDRLPQEQARAGHAQVGDQRGVLLRIVAFGGLDERGEARDVSTAATAIGRRRRGGRRRVGHRDQDGTISSVWRAEDQALLTRLEQERIF